MSATEHTAGYRPCHCRDCFETVIGLPGVLCTDCQEADCDPDQECENPHAYGGADGSGHCGSTRCCGPLSVSTPDRRRQDGTDTHLEERLAKSLTDHLVPPHLHPGLQLWLTHGIEPGSFLQAVLKNDLTGAVFSADGTSTTWLATLVRALQIGLPHTCWGDEATYAEWREARGPRQDTHD